MSRLDILNAISTERNRTEERQAMGELDWTAASPDCPDILRLAALVEEVGEVARAIHDGAHGIEPGVEIELLQVAAVAVAWLESLE